MNRSRLELKVGLFVFLCLALVAGLMIRFSKGTTFFRPTYDLILKAGNVGGLRPKASVLMSGVQIGTVSVIKLGEEGTNVTITIKVYKEFSIREDARFVIEQSGFLGDQFVAIYPLENKGFKLLPGAIAHVEEPFNLQEVARSAVGFIAHIDETARRVNDVITNLQQEVLNRETMTNLAASIKDLQQISSNAVLLVENLNGLIVSNRANVGESVSNMLFFTEKLNASAQSLHDLVKTNEAQISLAVSNIQTTTVMLTNLMSEAEGGKGLVGVLLKNEAFANDISSLASNLNLYSGYLRSNSFWKVLFSKPREPVPDKK